MQLETNKRFPTKTPNLIQMYEKITNGHIQMEDAYNRGYSHQPLCIALLENSKTP
jgi:hypothetical protein